MKKSYLLTAVFLISSVFMSSDKEDKISAQETINPNTSWPQIQYDANRSGYVPQTIIGPFEEIWRTCSKRHWEEYKTQGKSDEEALMLCQERNPDIKILPPLGEDPNVESNFGVSYRVQPIVADNKVFIPSNNGVLYAFNDTDGKVAWKYPDVDNGENPIGPLMASVGYHDGKVYFGSSDKNIYAIRSSDGQLIKKFKTKGMIKTAPLIAENKVFIGSRDGKMYAFDLNLNKIWEYDTKYPIEDTAGYDNGGIFFGNMGSIGYGLDAGTGNLKFEREISSGQGFKDRWTVAKNGKAYFTPIPKRNYHDVIGDGTSLFHDKNDNGLCDNDEIWCKDWSVQKSAIINHLREKPENRVFYTVKTSDGTDYFNVPEPILYFSGGGVSEHVPPVILPDGKAFVNYRRTFNTPSKFGQTTNHSLYVGKLYENNSSPDIEKFEYCPDGIDDDKCIKGNYDPPLFKSYHISDESDSMIVAGNSLIINNSRSGTILNKENNIETKYGPFVCYSGSFSYLCDRGEDVLFDDYSIQTNNLGGRITHKNETKKYSETNSDGNNSAGVPPVVVGEYIYILHYNSLSKVKATIK